jgi:GNAT superfamily N-acetyltransferase
MLAQEPAPLVRRLCDDDVASRATALARAFERDPVYRFIHPDDDEWSRVAPRFFELLLRHFAVHATVLTPGAGGAAAIWLQPTAPQPAALARLRFTLRVSALLGRRLRRGARVGRALDALSSDESHWYLALLGTDPVAQGRGLATSLLAPVLARCDAASLPARLETATESNLPFYAARGFTVVGETRVSGGGPRLWALRRAPVER